MKRLLFLLLAPIAATTITMGAPRSITHAARAALRPFDVVEATIYNMQDAMERGDITSEELVDVYLNRIHKYEGTLNAVISVNRFAPEQARELDRERAAGRVRGLLHGIPIALKDNIHTRDMPTTGGALAFAGYIPPYEATLTRQLTNAGAVIIAKTVLTELANWMANGMPANYSAVGGYGLNPYDPRPDPRPGTNDGRAALGTGGSSSGIGTAANLWAASVGTETSGSILSPTNANMLVGIKPTVGLISRWGVIPITADQDTPGPMARTVADAAILLGGMTREDPRDPATALCPPVPGHDYTRFLRRTGLRGARIGIPRAIFYEPFRLPGSANPSGGLNATNTAIINEAMQILRDEGAVLVDPADIPSVIDGTAANNVQLWGVCSGATNPANCSTVLKYGFKRDFNAWLASLGPGAPVKTLTELRAFNVANASRNSMKYAQALLDVSDAVDLNLDRTRYEADRANDIRLTATHGIGEAMDRNKLDALFFNGVASSGIAARPGYPTIAVPFTRVPNAPGTPFPAGFNAQPGPSGVSFTSTACNEGRLIEIAYAFEQATKRRVPPPAVP